MDNNTPEESGYSFEEFKLYYESAERVTDRRLRYNELNLSVCLAIIAGIGIAWSWGLSNKSYTYILFSLTALLSAVAALYSLFWYLFIRDYKTLNKAKFDVLEDMASKVRFPPLDAASPIISYQPWRKEWQKMKALRARRNPERHGVGGLKSTTLEYFVPVAFGAVFVAIFVISLLPICFHLALFLKTWQAFLGM